mgnify:CR=1 FL=1
MDLTPQGLGMDICWCSPTHSLFVLFDFFFSLFFFFFFLLWYPIPLLLHVANQDQILLLTFQYIQLIKQQGLQKWIYDEVRLIPSKWIDPSCLNPHFLVPRSNNWRILDSNSSNNPRRWIMPQLYLPGYRYTYPFDLPQNNKSKYGMMIPSTSNKYRSILP